jgi:DNA repair protein RadC
MPKTFLIPNVIMKSFDILYEQSISDSEISDDFITANTKSESYNRLTEKEVMTVEFYCSDGYLLKEATASSKSRTYVEIPVRDLVKEALILDARFIALFHNHPSGDPRPSDSDIVQTRRLVRLLEPLGIRLRDHIITTTNKKFSFREAGLI